MSGIAKNLAVALKGYAMGAANVIPGVSGGTIALLTGIFNELVEALNALMSFSSWKLLFKASDNILYFISFFYKEIIHLFKIAIINLISMFQTVIMNNIIIQWSVINYMALFIIHYMYTA